jgi:hypothetical protein
MKTHPIRISFLAIAALLCVGTQSSAGPALDRAYMAVVQIPSHGCSGTFIHTEGPSQRWSFGMSLILTCAHCEPESGTPIHLNAPAVQPGTRRVNPRFIKWDYRADLALIRIEYGPVPYVADLAEQITTHQAVSCGYDEMCWPAKRIRTTITQVSTQHIQTKEKPWHGRSGGPLFNLEGKLVGVCQGYSLTHGLYRPLSQIKRFLPKTGTPQPIIQEPACPI